MKKKLLVLLVLISVTINFVNAQCLPPTNFFVSNITNNSVTLSWVPNTTTTTSEYNIQLFMNGTTVAGNFTAQTSPYVLTGLPCGTTCSAQIVSVCSPNVISPPSVLVTFTTLPCPPQFGQPQSMTACVTNGFGCFNLASNTQNILKEVIFVNNNIINIIYQ